MKKALLRCSVSLAVFFSIMGLASYSLLAGESQFSSALRDTVETQTNGLLARLSQSTSDNTLTPFDKILIRTFAYSGIALGHLVYPEAAQVLSHYIDGNGEPLALRPDFFQSSPFLKAQVLDRSDGTYGPIGFEQKRDWRLSLVLNPFYLSITGDKVKLYHPNIEFAHTHQDNVHTVVPIGKLNIVFYDNLISALNPTPFYVYSEWTITPA